MSDLTAEYDDPQYIVDKIDNEGYPDALEWLHDMNFEDLATRTLIRQGWELWMDLLNLKKELFERLKEQGVDVYI